MPEIQENVRDATGRFKKGFSGNPAGPGKRAQTIPGMLEKVRAWIPVTAEKKLEILSAWGKELPDNADALFVVMLKVYEMAEDGDMEAIKFIADRLDGKPIPIVPEDQRPESVADSLKALAEAIRERDTE
jgi:hypothetical protein